ncbi:metallophosphoesterase [Candidatus Micrarchaeota archaeon]|nr:metallophosphoesterase [Candidatus Micrarchaeota archaeon]
MKFLYNAPAILHRGALIIGDTHFGMEEKLRGRGIFDEMLSERIFGRIMLLLKKTKAKKLIIAGDVKDDILRVDEKTIDILGRLAKRAELAIVKGNHDGGLEKICGVLGIGVSGPGGIVYGKIGIMHGHSWPDEKLMQCDYLVSAHQHPQISVVDRSGKIHRQAAWLVAEADAEKTRETYPAFNGKIKLVLLPAFNPLVGSTINKPGERQLGPILNNKLFKLNDALVIGLDGSLVGKLKDVKK